MRNNVVYISLILLVLHSCSNDRPKFSNKEIKKGKKLFSKYCDECHNNNMIHDMTAPALGYALEKRDSIWFVKHILKGTHPIDSTDSVAMELRNEGWALMPSYNFLTKPQINAIILYIREEFNKNKK